MESTQHYYFQQQQQQFCPPTWALCGKTGMDYSETESYRRSSTASSSSEKENNGHGSGQRRRRKRFCRFVCWILVAGVTYQILVAHFLRGFVPDIEIDKATGRKKIRRRPERTTKIGPDGRIVKRSPLDGIIEGHLHLIDIHIPTKAAATTPTRYNIKATFCVLEWTSQQRDPTSVPLFDDVVASSELCQATKQTTDLFDVVAASRQWDLQLRNATLNHDIWKREQNKHLPQPEAHPVERSIPPTALIFHESRCGSTLVSNLLASFDPLTTKVYSEPAPPLKALQLQDDSCPTSSGNKNKYCAQHRQLVRDIFYMMGRTQRHINPEHNIFYKLQSEAVAYVDLLEESLPQPVPWMYLYRDNVPVLNSHFLGSIADPKSEPTNLLGQRKTPKCLQKYGLPNDQQPPTLLNFVHKSQGQRTVQSLSKEEYCAAHLASLSEAAMEHFVSAQESSKRHQRTPHFFVNYNQLPDILWDHVLPTIGVQLKATDIHRMEKVGAMYSHGRGAGSSSLLPSFATTTSTKKKKKKTSPGGSTAVITGGSIFKGDSHHKTLNASPSIVDAARTFMDTTYNKLEGLKEQTLKQPIKLDPEDDDE